MKNNIIISTFLSVIFAFSLLSSYNLSIVLIALIFYLVISLKNEELIIIFYFFLYLCLAAIANNIYIGYGKQSTNIIGIFHLMLTLTFLLKFKNFVNIKKEYWNKNLIYPMFFFMFCLILSIPFSNYLTSSIRGLNRILSIISFYFLAYYITINNKTIEKKIFSFVFVIFFMLSICGIIEYVIGYNIFTQESILYETRASYHVTLANFNRIRTTFWHPSSYACIILTFLPLLIYYFVKLKKKLYLFFLGLLLLNLIFTFTRIAWLAVAIQIISSLLLFKSKRMLVYGSLLLPLVLVMIGKVSQRLTLQDTSAMGRLRMMWHGISLFKANPLFGIGFNTLVEATNYGGHCDYIGMFAETGILGGTSYLILLFSNLFFAIKNLKQSDFSKIALLTIIGFMVFSITDNGLINGHIFWALLGIYNGLIMRKNINRHPLQIAHSRIVINSVKQL